MSRDYAFEAAHARHEARELDRYLESTYGDGPDIEAAGFRYIGKRKDGTTIWRRRNRFNGRCEVVTLERAEEIVEKEEEDKRERQDAFDREDW